MPPGRVANLISYFNEPNRNCCRFWLDIVSDDQQG